MKEPLPYKTTGSVMNYKRPDSTGFVPDFKLIGAKFMHQDGGVYFIGGFAWDAERNLWMIGYQNVFASENDKSFPGPIVFTRSHLDFFGQRNGRPRFTRLA